MGVGFFPSVGALPPDCPYWLSPQQTTELSCRIAQLWWAVATSDLRLPSPSTTLDGQTYESPPPGLAALSLRIVTRTPDRPVGLDPAGTITTYPDLGDGGKGFILIRLFALPRGRIAGIPLRTLGRSDTAPVIGADIVGSADVVVVAGGPTGWFMITAAVWLTAIDGTGIFVVALGRNNILAAPRLAEKTISLARSTFIATTDSSVNLCDRDATELWITSIYRTFGRAFIGAKQRIPGCATPRLAGLIAVAGVAVRARGPVGDLGVQLMPILAGIVGARVLVIEQDRLMKRFSLPAGIDGAGITVICDTPGGRNCLTSPGRLVAGLSGGALWALCCNHFSFTLLTFPLSAGFIPLTGGLHLGLLDVGVEVAAGGVGYTIELQHLFWV